MSTVDLIFLGIVALGAVIGAVRGLLREFLGLLQVLAAAAVSLLLLDQTRPLVLKVRELPAGPGRDLVPWTVGFLLLYLVLLGVLSIARGALRRRGSEANRFPGAVVGALRTALLLAALAPLLVWAAPLDDSAALRAVRQAADSSPARYLVPGSFPEYLATEIRR